MLTYDHILRFVIICDQQIMQVNISLLQIYKLAVTEMPN